MSNLFNYNTLLISLNPNTKTLIVRLNRPDVQNAINTEMAFELESVLAWAGSHLEVNSILLSSTSDIFSVGIDPHELNSMDKTRIKKLMTKIQKVIHAMFYLPQTILVDLKNGASGIGAELTLGADIRIANRDSYIEFNHNNQGLTPACGGVGILGAIIPKSFARNWVLTSNKIQTSEMLLSGFILDTYEEDEDLISNLLSNISKQSQMARIQTKRSLLEFISPILDRVLAKEALFANATMEAPDWKKYSESRINDSFDPVEFIAPRDFVSKGP